MNMLGMGCCTFFDPGESIRLHGKGQEEFLLWTSMHHDNDFLHSFCMLDFCLRDFAIQGNLYKLHGRFSFGELEKMMFPTITPGCHQLLDVSQIRVATSRPKNFPDVGEINPGSSRRSSMFRWWEGFPGVPHGISWKIYDDMPWPICNSSWGIVDPEDEEDGRWLADEAWSSSFGPCVELKDFVKVPNWQRLLKKKKCEKFVEKNPGFELVGMKVKVS